MDAFYFDSSALVKRYAKEKGTNFLIGLLRQPKTFCIPPKLPKLKSAPPFRAVKKV